MGSRGMNADLVWPWLVLAVAVALAIVAGIMSRREPESLWTTRILGVAGVSLGALTVYIYLVMER